MGTLPSPNRLIGRQGLAAYRFGTFKVCFYHSIMDRIARLCHHTMANSKTWAMRAGAVAYESGRHALTLAGHKTCRLAVSSLSLPMKQSVCMGSTASIAGRGAFDFMRLQVFVLLPTHDHVRISVLYLFFLFLCFSRFLSNFLQYIDNGLRQKQSTYRLDTLWFSFFLLFIRGLGRKKKSRVLGCFFA